MTTPASGSSRVLILGAGYAGLAAAHQLERSARRHAVTLLDRNPYHTLETQLHQAAAHASRVTIPIEPLIAGTRIRYYPGQVVAVDLDAREVTTADGARIGYHLLLIALGSVTNFYRIRGLAEHALELKTAADAERIHHWLLRAYHPDSSAPDRDIVIGGGGLTGVELASELALSARNLASERGLPPGRIHLVEAGPTILPNLDEEGRRHALDALAGQGVAVHTATRVVSAEAGKLHLDGGATLTGGLIVWTGGVRAQEVVRGERLERGPANRIVVNRTLAVRGYEGSALAAGDAALALGPDGNPVPTTGQHAAQQGRLAGRNIAALLAGRPPSEYKPSTLGELISLGGLAGVGWVRLPWRHRLRLTGHLAGLVKRASEWRHLQEAQGNPKL